MESLRIFLFLFGIPLVITLTPVVFLIFLFLGKRSPINTQSSEIEKKNIRYSINYSIVSLLVSFLIFRSYIWRISYSYIEFKEHYPEYLDPIIIIQVVGLLLVLGLGWMSIRPLKEIKNRKKYLILPIFSIVLGWILTIILPLYVKIVSGFGWGRPLRINGKEVKPELEDGNDWCEGTAPDVTGVDEDSKKALEALWLHDAKKEYASVPAFSRLSWQLFALGAPPDLMRDLHLAGLQEIEHTKKCFALAAGFGSTAKTAQPMTDILHKFDNITGDPFYFLAVESLNDGCLMEGFNADIALEASKICKDEASLKVIKQIAREERFHEEVSWRVLEFCLLKNKKEVARALQAEIKKIHKTPRPTPATKENQALVDRANPQWLVHYGRVPEREFEKLWQARIEYIKEKIDVVCGVQPTFETNEFQPRL